MNKESKKEFRERIKVDLSYPFDAEELLLNEELKGLKDRGIKGRISSGYYPFDAEEMLLNAEFKEEGCTK